MEMLSRDEAERRLRERAASDSTFRAQLIADPRAAIQSELGMPIPQAISVQVHEESLSEMHLVLPLSEEELSDAMLETVSGGGCYLDCPSDQPPCA